MKQNDESKSKYFALCIRASCEPCADVVVVIPIALFPRGPRFDPRTRQEHEVLMNTLVCSCGSFVKPSSDGPQPLGPRVYFMFTEPKEFFSYILSNFPWAKQSEYFLWSATGVHEQWLLAESSLSIYLSTHALSTLFIVHLVYTAQAVFFYL